MSGPLQPELRGLLDAGVSFARRRDAVAALWRDEVFRSIDRRALAPIAAELRHFHGVISDVDRTLEQALRQLED